MKNLGCLCWKLWFYELIQNAKNPLNIRPNSWEDVVWLYYNIQCIKTDISCPFSRQIWDYLMWLESWLSLYPDSVVCMRWQLSETGAGTGRIHIHTHHHYLYFPTMWDGCRGYKQGCKKFSIQNNTKTQDSSEAAKVFIVIKWVNIDLKGATKRADNHIGVSR